MNEQEFKQRTKAIALRVIRMVESLPTTRTADVIGWQLLRSGTRRAGVPPAVGARPARPPYVAGRDARRLRPGRPLSGELLVDAGIVTGQKLRNLMNEIDEILAMTVASIRTLRKRNPKSKIQNPK